MALFTPVEARKLVRQSAVWVNPTRYPASHPNKANVIAELAFIHDRRPSSNTAASNGVIFGLN